MDTDIRYLELIEDDLRAVAAREELLASTPRATRRSRLGWATFAAAIVPVLVVAGLIGWLATGGVGGTADERAASGGAKTGYTTGHNTYPGTAPGDASGTPVPDQAAPFEDPDASAPSIDVSKIVRDGTIAIQLANGDFSKGFASVTRIAENHGGFVLSSQTRGQRTGALTLRIPAKRFDDAMLSLRAIGTVQAQSMTGHDVTAQFIDLQARLRIAKDRRTVLLGLQSQASTIGEVLAVQRQLDQTQLQIEQIQGQLNVINDQVAEATIRVNLHEEDARGPIQTNVVENPSLGSAWDRAVQGFLNVVSAVVIGLGYLIPVGLLAFGIWLLTLAVRRRRAAS